MVSIEEYGIAIHTSVDGGKIWQRQECSSYLGDIAAISKKEAWAIESQFAPDGSTGPALFHTKDGGKSWQKISHPFSNRKDIEFSGICFFDQLHGWVVYDGPLAIDPTGKLQGNPIIILRTIDGGKSWQVSSPPWTDAGYSDLKVPQVHFSSTQEGWLAVETDHLLHTTDGGRNWQAVRPIAPRAEPYPLLTFNDCAFITPQVGWVVGDDSGNPILLSTKDGGKSWQKEESGIENVESGHLCRIVFLDAKHGWIIGDGGPYRNEIPGRRISFILKYVP